MNRFCTALPASVLVLPFLKGDLPDRPNIIRIGWKPGEEPKIGHGGKWQLNVYDPDETRVEFMEFTPVQKTLLLGICRPASVETVKRFPNTMAPCQNDIVCK